MFYDSFKTELDRVSECASQYKLHWDPFCIYRYASCEGIFYCVGMTFLLEKPSNME